MREEVRITYPKREGMRPMLPIILVINAVVGGSRHGKTWTVMKTIEEVTKEHFEELYDNFDKDTLFPSIWMPGVKMTIPISCPKCEEEIEINVEVDADIMWEDDVPDDRISDIEGFKVTKILIFSTNQSTYLNYQSSEEFLPLYMRETWIYIEVL